MPSHKDNVDTFFENLRVNNVVTMKHGILCRMHLPRNFFWGGGGAAYSTLDHIDK